MAVHSGATGSPQQMIFAQPPVGGMYSEMDLKQAGPLGKIQPTPIPMPQSSKHGPWGEWAKSEYGWTDKDLDIANACLIAFEDNPLSQGKVPGQGHAVKTPPVVAQALIYGSKMQGIPGGCALRPELAQGTLGGIGKLPVIGLPGIALDINAVPANGQDGSSIAPPAAPPSQPTPVRTGPRQLS